MSGKSFLTHGSLATVVLDEHLMPIPSGQGDTCCHITMDIPKCGKTNPDVADHHSFHGESKLETGHRLQCLVSGTARGQADRST